MVAVVFRTFHGLAQSLERLQRLAERRRDSGGAISGDAVLRQHPLDGRKAVVRAVHDVVACATVNVNVDEARCEDCIAEVHNPTFGWDSYSRACPNRRDDSVLDEQRTIINLL